MKSQTRNVKAAYFSRWHGPNTLFILALALFSGFVVGSTFLRHQTLYWDTGRLFTQFRDHLHSLNQFGEIAWWYPQYQGGIPAYYISLLNTAQNSSPVMVGLGTLAWIFGRLGVLIEHFQPWYVIYFAFLVPGLFLCSVEKIARELAFSRSTRRALLVFSAFSPGVLFNMSDVGFLEPLSYGLFFLAAWLRFLRHPNQNGLLSLATATLVLAISANNAFVYWNAIALPVMTLLISILPLGNRRGWIRTKRALGGLGYRSLWIVGLFVLGMAPALVTWAQHADIINPALGGQRFYELDQFLAGNPLELLTTSLPGFGFDWLKGRQLFSLRPFSNQYHSAYYYMGLLALPFMLFGLLKARKESRQAGLLLVLFAFAAVPLSTASPFMNLLLSLPTPLRACNHFGDGAFKTGAFSIALFLVALGWESFRKTHKQEKGHFVVLFLWSSALNVLVAIYLLGFEITHNAFFGVTLIWILCYGVVLLNSLTTSTPRETMASLSLVLILELSTHAFLYLRTIERSEHLLDSGWKANAAIDETPGSSGIGMKLANHQHYYANRFLMSRSLYEMIGKVPFQNLPPIALFTEAEQSQTDLDPKAFATPAKKIPLALASASPSIQQAFAPFLHAGREAAKGNIAQGEASYNHLVFQISLNQPAILFLRQAYSPYWRATANGESVALVKAFHHFKAAALPAGTYELTLNFKPPWVGSLLLMAYGMLGLLMKLSLGKFRNDRSVVRRLFPFTLFPINRSTPA